MGGGARGGCCCPTRAVDTQLSGRPNSSSRIEALRPEQHAGVVDGNQQTKETSMARVFITGSSTGLGLMAGQLLIEQGHEVVLHARNDERREHARRALPQADAVVV